MKNETKPIHAKAFVFFSTGAMGRPLSMPFRRWMRLVRFDRAAGMKYGLGWFIRWLTQFPSAHVAIGYDGAVLDPTFAGNYFYAIDAYAIAYKGLIGIVEVPISQPIDLEMFPVGKPKHAIPTIIRWWTVGNWPVTEDCVQIVSACLRQGGVKVPDRILSPRQLFLWLMKQGYHYVPTQ